MLRFVVGLALVFSALLPGECVAVRETTEGRVRVVAVDLLGKPVEGATVAFLGRSDPDFERKPVRDVSKVPYGVYRIRVDSPGFRRAWREVSVYQPEMTVRVPLDLGVECPEPPVSVAGTVKRDSGKEEVWVKVIPLRGVGGGEAPVGRFGRFLVGGLERGDYILLVTSGDRVVHTQPVKTYPVGTDTTNLTVDVRGK